MNLSTDIMQDSSPGNGSFDFAKMDLFVLSSETLVIICIFSAIFVVGMLGNIALLSYVICRNRMTSPHNIYSTNLAIADLLTLVIAMPFLSSIYVLTNWPFGEPVCKLSECIHTLTTSITVFMITALSIERYRVTTVYQTSSNLPSASVISFFLWLVAAMLAITDLVSAETVSHKNFHFCQPYKAAWGETYAKTLTLIKFAFTFAIPMFIITSFYFLIGYKLSSKCSRYDSCYYGENHAEVEEAMSRNSRRKRMVVLVFGLVLVFVVTWLPRHVYLMWFYFDPSPYDFIWHVVKLTGVCLMFCNAALNPLVFFSFDPRFRDYCFCSKSQSSGDLEEYNELPHETVILSDLPGNSVILTNVTQKDGGTKV
ncbi:neuropeptide CCHamide-1 receptor-like [Saccostrea echinata]|uniref:neuropeptide CCHamide-1 receptor-like n=1 Tax=Saccostrea echinata TaxID=191078 RepID=UPI002A8148EB|nr:neuropeptide CCHamide-1 receptor-like [Saccostrea echinata]